MTIESFDQLTNFKDGEDKKYLVEYILADSNGFCHRASPFLMPVGTVFEHEYGRYLVVSIDRKPNNIIVYCEYIDNNIKIFNTLHEMKKHFN